MTAPREPQTGAVPVKSKGGVPWWLIALAVLLVALLIWVLFAAFDDDDGGVDAAPPVTTGQAVVVDVGDVPAGTAMAGDVDVFADGVAPPALVGDTVTGNAVLVQELVADEAFYVGPEQGNTILVRLEKFAGEGSQESPFSVEAGDKVSFTGELREIDEEFVSQLQLYDPAEELELGDYYVQIDEISSVD